MLESQPAEALTRRALQYAHPHAMAVCLTACETALTRFANNAIHQSVAEQNITATLRAVIGRRVGTASTNDLSDAGLARAAEHAVAHAHQQPEDPEFPGLPEPRPYPAVASYDARTADLGADVRARGVATICRLARDARLVAAGAFRSGVREVAVANSHGLFAYHAGTFADIQLVVAGPDGSGWAQGSAWRVDGIDIEALGREAVQRARRAQRPRRLAPGVYTLVVEPYVTEELLGTLSFSGMGAQAVQQGHSWMSTRIGTQAMSQLVSIWDDGTDPLGAPLPFDGEGMPRQRVPLVERGVVCGPVYDRATGAREGRETTGHAAMADDPFADGPVASHLVMAAGDATVEQMIASTDRGLYITRFWYPRLVHPRDCIVTAMTRDGVWLIERGGLAYPVKNLRFTQSYVAALAHVEAVGCVQRTLIGDWGSVTRVPALKIADFSFHSVTSE